MSFCYFPERKKCRLIHKTWSYIITSVQINHRYTYSLHEILPKPKQLKTFPIYWNIVRNFAMNTYEYNHKYNLFPNSHCSQSTALRKPLYKAQSAAKKSTQKSHSRSAKHLFISINYRNLGNSIRARADHLTYGPNNRIYLFTTPSSHKKTYTHKKHIHTYKPFLGFPLRRNT